jgi:hypothetical protein
MEYTKGEWKDQLVMGERDIYVDENANGSPEVICRGVRHWNKDIIKAAPAMYEALKQWMIYAESNYSGDGMTAVSMTTKALDKAEGK